MRMKSLLGLLAIGGAVAYAQKKRGGALTIEGFKKTARELFGTKAHKRVSDDELPSYSSSGRVGTTTRSGYGGSSEFGSSPNGTGGTTGR